MSYIEYSGATRKESVEQEFLEIGVSRHLKF